MWRPGIRGAMNLMEQRGHGHLLVAQAVPTAAWMPSPASARRAVIPTPGVKGSPTPGVGRHPRIAGARIPRPDAVGKGIPGCAGEVGPPHCAASARIGEAAVVVQVIDAV